jgi:hypothetical protein
MATPTVHDVFWLARYAHNKMAPLFAELKTLEPSTQFNIDMSFADATSVYQKDNHVTVDAHWGRTGMFLQSGHMLTKADIDKLAEQVRAKVDTLILQDAVAELATV